MMFMKKIVVAGGCFWGVAEYYRRVKGITYQEAGYAQGTSESPTYQEVCTSNTNHAEVVYLEYDEKVISLNKILEHLFRMIDPTSLNRQGNDIGVQYRTGVYYMDNEDGSVVRNFIENHQKLYDEPIVVEVEPLIKFWSAEEYHQNYLVKNPRGYCHVDMSLIEEHELKDEFR